MELIDNDAPAARELAELYASVGWDAYLADPAALAASVARSTYVVTARSEGRLIGLARGLSDDFSVFYLQDLLVHPDHQRRGIGRALLKRCVERFAHVRQKVLLTDDEPHQHQLYESAGYRDVTEIRPLHAFARLDQVD